MFNSDIVKFAYCDPMILNASILTDLADNKYFGSSSFILFESRENTFGLS